MFCSPCIAYRGGREDPVGQKKDNDPVGVRKWDERIQQEAKARRFS